MRFLPCIFLAIVLLPFGAKAQVVKEPEMTGEKFAVSIRSMNFFRNDEYFNPIEGSGFNLTGELPLHLEKSLWVEGYTLTGFFFRPELVYNPSEKITLRAGGHFLKYWGDTGFQEARPVFSTSLKIAPKTELILGSLSGSDKHRMYDPHFNYERLYSAFAEEGAEIRTENDHIFNDAWISWENFIFKGDNEREIFTFGESFRYTSPKFSDLIDIELPVQLQFKHFGGQISDYPERVTTFANLAAGVRVNFYPGEGSGKLGLEFTGFLNKVIPDRETYIIRHGSASWLRLHYTLNKFYFGASYWLADDFYAPNGNGIYTSIFVFDSDYVIHQRKIITGSASFRLLPEDYLELFLGFEGFYDVNEKRLDHAITLHLDFENIFRVK